MIITIKKDETVILEKTILDSELIKILPIAKNFLSMVLPTDNKAKDYFKEIAKIKTIVIDTL